MTFTIDELLENNPYKRQVKLVIHHTKYDSANWSGVYTELKSYHKKKQFETWWMSDFNPNEIHLEY